MSLLKRESLLSLSFFIALKMTELNVPIVYCKLLYLLDKNFIKLKKVINNEKKIREREYIVIGFWFKQQKKERINFYESKKVK